MLNIDKKFQCNIELSTIFINPIVNISIYMYTYLQVICK